MQHSHRPVVLIVEDEPLVRMLAVEAFEEAGFVVLEAEHAASALEVYAHAPNIRLLFTDVNMPGDLNGIDLAEHLARRAPHLKIIVTSALPILRSVAHLPATFVSKPYNLTLVSQTAHALMAA